MVLPIYLYGSDVLREEAEEIENNSEALQTLIDNMLETMHGAAGIGLAGPQVGQLVRLFVVDLEPLRDDLEEDGEEIPPQPMVFINPEIVDESQDIVAFEEGCLSIPDIRYDIDRPSVVTVEYLDREFNEQRLTAKGMLARVIQHEYDHVEGVLFVDYLSSFKRKLLARRLRDISAGAVESDYPVLAPLKMA
ncbi:MAG: peptide deformylase [Rhodothermales bacterium]|nr:peptide deformylase [Rhodothermales bacterium]